MAVHTTKVYSNATYLLQLSIKANGGDTAPYGGYVTKTSNAASVTVSKALPNTLPTWVGHDFLGYALSNPSNAVSKQPGDTISKTFTRSATFDHADVITEGDEKYRTEYYNSSDQSAIQYIYAKWKTSTYTISYNVGGGTNAPEDQTKTYGVDLTLTSAVPTWSGHTFLGWNTAADGTGTSYAPGDTFTTDANTTLYAVWSASSFSVTFNANGGSNPPAAQTKTYGAPLTLTESIPTYTGHTFVEWNTAADGTGESYAPGDTYNANADLDLYAIWVVTTYTVTYDANGHGTAPAAQTKTAGGDVTVAAAITATGSTFVAWNTAADGTGTRYDPGDTYSADADVTLYAIWTVAEYTVTFDADGGTVSPASKQVTYGAKYGTLPVPEKTGETFYGWFLGDLLVTENSIVDLDDDATLTAAWSPRSMMRVKGSDNQMHTGALYVKGSDGQMHMAIAYVKGFDGQMHING